MIKLLSNFLLPKAKALYFFSIIFLVAILLSTNAHSQQKFTLNGYIKDSLSGETLLGANITAKSEGKGATTNQYGFYSITLKNGTYQLVASFVGYQTKEILISLNANQQKNILLIPNNINLKEVTVIGKKRDNNVKAAQMGKIDMVTTLETNPKTLARQNVQPHCMPLQRIPIQGFYPLFET